MRERPKSMPRENPPRQSRSIFRRTAFGGNSFTLGSQFGDEGRIGAPVAFAGSFRERREGGLASGSAINCWEEEKTQSQVTDMAERGKG